MNAYLYDVKIHCVDHEYSFEHEFIVVSDCDDSRDKEASRIYEWYLQWYLESRQLDVANSALGAPQLLDNNLYLENTKKNLDWKDLQQRQLAQEKRRPREIGCVFRGGARDVNDGLTPEGNELLEESIRYFMDEHRVGNDSFLFVASKWSLSDRLRHSNIIVLEACGINLASDIAQLEFISLQGDSVYINWCCPIYLLQ